MSLQVQGVIVKMADKQRNINKACGIMTKKLSCKRLHIQNSIDKICCQMYHEINTNA